jgi:hypothetical protein
MWPAFAVLTLADGLILHWLPFGGDGWDVVPCLIAAGFANLVVVAVLGPGAGFLWRRRFRPDLPQMIAADYAGTALLLVLTLAYVAGGLIHRPLIDEKNADRESELAAARAYFISSAPAEYQRNLARVDTLKLQADLYRTCVPGPDPDRALCVFVSTDTAPPGIRADPNRETNTSFAGRFGAYRAR